MTGSTYRAVLNLIPTAMFRILNNREAHKIIKSWLFQIDATALFCGGYKEDYDDCMSVASLNADALLSVSGLTELAKHLENNRAMSQSILECGTCIRLAQSRAYRGCSRRFAQSAAQDCNVGNIKSRAPKLPCRALELAK
jgi:hypothetical protein